MYKIKFHNLVEKDWLPIPKNDIKKIKSAIQKKLKTAPETFGKPLRKELKGYRTLRIDPYRIIYKVKEKEILVFILNIGLRKDQLVYLEAAKRLKLI